ncbi:MAG TPA: hypothetical protein PKX00_22145 [Opitutaceae bacterium]|jgi:hypothetical protein|nr:hypothetical protein [Opitutaceae bacterium]HRE08336.1 hypothetical protein [Opitutaceae bacterium]
MKNIPLLVRLLLWTSPALLALGLGGCATPPKPSAYTIEVTLDPALAGTSLQVDVVGANELSDLPKWQTYSVTEYWQPGNAFRRDARKATLAFGRGRPDTQSLAVDDPKWAEWLRTGALHLVLIADLPGPVSDQTGNADPRRLILPLDRAAWDRKLQKLQIVVQESGLRLMTPRRP